MQVCRGGDEISFTNMGLVAEMVLAQVCVRLVSSSVGRLARGANRPTNTRARNFAVQINGFMSLTSLV